MLYVRYYLEPISKWLPAGVDAAAFVAGMQNAILVVAVLAGMVLVLLRGQPWQKMQVVAQPVPA